MKQPIKSQSDMNAVIALRLDGGNLNLSIFSDDNTDVAILAQLLADRIADGIPSESMTSTNESFASLLVRMHARKASNTRMKVTGGQLTDAQIEALADFLLSSTEE